jgi:hypothetical protein
MQQATIQQLSLFLLPIHEYLTPDTHTCTIFKLRSRSKTFQLALRTANARATVKNEHKKRQIRRCSILNLLQIN